jgi:hypothetical protein
MFLTDILGVPEAIASEDACMIEHLVSSEVSVELLRLTTFLRSQHPVAKQFRDAYRASPRACAAHAAGASGSPDSSGVCADTCLHDSLMCDIGVAAADDPAPRNATPRQPNGALDTLLPENAV